jgi:hypothetical protein
VVAAKRGQCSLPARSALAGTHARNPEKAEAPSGCSRCGRSCDYPPTFRPKPVGSVSPVDSGPQAGPGCSSQSRHGPLPGCIQGGLPRALSDSEPTPKGRLSPLRSPGCFDGWEGTPHRAQLPARSLFGFRERVRSFAGGSEALSDNRQLTTDARSPEGARLAPRPLGALRWSVLSLRWSSVPTCVVSSDPSGQDLGCPVGCGRPLRRGLLPSALEGRNPRNVGKPTRPTVASSNPTRDPFSRTNRGFVALEVTLVWFVSHLSRIVRA